MSLLSLNHSLCSLYRPAVTKDSSGAQVQTFELVAAYQDMQCDVQPASSRVQFRFMQQQLVVSHSIFFTQDIGARAGDQLVIDDGISPKRIFLIQPAGYEPPAPGYANWPAVAHVEEQRPQA